MLTDLVVKTPVTDARTCCACGGGTDPILGLLEYAGKAMMEVYRTTNPWAHRLCRPAFMRQEVKDAGCCIVCFGKGYVYTHRHGERRACTACVDGRVPLNRAPHCSRCGSTGWIKTWRGDDGPYKDECPECFDIRVGNRQKNGGSNG